MEEGEGEREGPSSDDGTDELGVERRRERRRGRGDRTFGVAVIVGQFRGRRGGNAGEPRQLQWRRLSARYRRGNDR